MKIFSKIGLLLLMLLLVAGAFILPKFVQRAEPPTPKEDLAAALAAVEILPQEAGEEKQAGSDLRENSDFDAFFNFLEDSNFESATETLVALSETVDEATVERLTTEMEKAVNALAPIEEPLSVLADNTPIEPAIAPPASEEPVPETTAPPSYDSGKTIEIMALIQEKRFAEVDEQIASIKENAPEKTVKLLEASLASAVQNQKELEESRKKLSQSREDLSLLQKESVMQIRESVAELKEATLSANQAVKEVAMLREQMESTGSLAGEAAAQRENSKGTAQKASTPVKIPEVMKISFGLNSTQLNEDSKKTLSEAADLLEEESRLSLQLRGFADPSGAPEYNAILARTRGEVAKDFLIEKKIPASRVSVISFGESRSESAPSTAEEARRVELVFRSE